MIDVDPREARSETNLPAGEMCAIAAGLATALRHETVHLPDPDRRQWRRLISTDDFDAWVIHWPVGGSVDPHDHGGSTGAVSVMRGELTEVRSMDGVLATQRLTVGSADVVPADAVHDIVNDGPAAAVSVHVYSPPLSTMVFYGPDGDAVRAEAVELERALWPEVIAGMAATA